MERCFLDGQFPCRWTPDLGGGFGFPLFNYYSPLVYYLGVVFRLTGFSFVGSIKLLFLTGIILSGISMYLLTKEFWGKLGGLVSAVFYIFVPFHALDIYVRGDLSEFFALAIVPFVFWAFYRLIKTNERQFLFLTGLFLGAFLLSHNITAMLFAPLLLVWIIFWFLVLKKIQKETVFQVLIAGLAGFGLSAFFIIPALLEQSLVQVGSLTTGYFDFKAHFITLRQLFLDRSWSFGISRFGPTDTLSFQIGWPHWWLVFLSFGLTILKLKDRGDFRKWLIILMSGLFLVLVFMIHPRSVIFWENLPLIAFTQFPWRLLGPVGLVSSFLAGSVIILLAGKDKVQVHLLAFFLVVLVVALNTAYFKPAKFTSATDEDFLTGETFKSEQQGAVYDFLPKGVTKLPDFDAQDIQIISGEANISEFVRKSDYFKVNIEVHGDQPAQIIAPVFDFAGWEVFVDEQPVTINKNPWGLIQMESPKGKHEISGWFRNTKIRLSGNGISIVTLLLVIYFFVTNDRKNKKFKK